MKMSDHSQTKKELEILRAVRKRKEYRERGPGLLMTDAEWEDYQNNFCQGCGGQKKNAKPHFGQMFCGECVEAFRYGKSK